jgi:lactocepin
MGHLFEGCSSLQTVDINEWDTSSVANMSYMFSCCDSLETLDLSKWDTGCVTNMSHMFQQKYIYGDTGHSHLIALDLSNWDVSSVMSMEFMFDSCNSLLALDISTWDTSSLNSMEGMFRDCRSLKTLDIDNLNTSSVTSFNYLFMDSQSLAALDLSDWDTSSVESMLFTFGGCTSLKTLDLSGWDTSALNPELAGLFYTIDSNDQPYYSFDAIESWSIGPKYDMTLFGFSDEFYVIPKATSATGKWWSQKDRVWLTLDEIASSRSGIADTYLSNKPGPGWVRLSGSGRYDTMAEIVSEGWSGQTGGTVVVATGEGFKDALSAAGLAGLDGGPVVLTAGKSLSSQAESQLRALRPSKVYVAGGTFAVSDDVLKAIKSATGVTPTRVSGQTSASTSAALATTGRGRWDGTAIVATNRSFKDALSVAPLSYAKRWPILLADDGKSLNKDVLKALKDCGIKRAYVVGGELAVTANVERQLKEAGVELAGRLAGANGPATSRAIADFALGNGLTAANMAFATSQNFPDALAGAALCGKNGSVLLLCDDAAKANLSFATDHAPEIETGYVFGGELAFSKGLFESLPR